MVCVQLSVHEQVMWARLSAQLAVVVAQASVRVGGLWRRRGLKITCRLLCAGGGLNALRFGCASKGAPMLRVMLHGRR